ncbi:hypothetical protein [Paenibacillus paeoniae]|uniref:Uncharacterized protein n=1 Tax=Paenibacillus paeoniae TaxID=2292705 RepID=A0A371PIP8_9BACL|nr:hypothetical protein [Paenibacillus paeoniae]REK76091.1 hypothetical protein DX130_03220 [Paenibacillus paeoniae]
MKAKWTTFIGDFVCESFIDLFYELLQFKMFHRLVSTKDIGTAQESRKVRNMAMMNQWILRFEQLQELAELEFAEKAVAFFDFIATYRRSGRMNTRMNRTMRRAAPYRSLLITSPRGLSSRLL